MQLATEYTEIFSGSLEGYLKTYPMAVLAEDAQIIQQTGNDDGNAATDQDLPPNVADFAMSQIGGKITPHEEKGGQGEDDGPDGIAIHLRLHTALPCCSLLSLAPP